MMMIGIEEGLTGILVITIEGGMDGTGEDIREGEMAENHLVR